jgi:hypothetical protein
VILCLLILAAATLAARLRSQNDRR